MISSLRALLQGNLQESWDECNNGWWESDVADSRDIGSWSRGSLSGIPWPWGVVAPWGCSGAQCCSVQELPGQWHLPVYSGLKAQHGIIGKNISDWILCLGLFPPAWEMCWWEMGNERQEILCHSTGATLHTWQSWTFPEHTLLHLFALFTRFLQENNKSVTAGGLGYLCMHLSIQN